jgi:hypothetical protein
MFAKLRQQSSAALDKAKFGSRKKEPREAPAADPEAPQEPQQAPRMMDSLRKQTSAALSRADSVPGVPAVRAAWIADAGRTLKLGLFGFEVSG